MAGRRTFVASVLGAGTGYVLGGCATTPARGAAEPREHGEIGVTAPEDLMREHGALERLLLVYQEGARRIDAGEDLDPKVLLGAVDLVATFVEGYHEKLEEEHVFPRFEGTRFTDLTLTLRAQHDAGRKVTGWLRATLGRGEAPAPVAGALRSYIRMYHPHSAREDTILFPALREVVPAAEFNELGERFEAIEHRELGEGGFDQAVSQVAEIEKKLGILDLTQFTPAPPTL